ncbi:MAG TPA: outer membrane beta-barrel protein [Kofleriaceae bacterium]
MRAAIIALALAVPTAAHAGTYIGLGVGTGGNVSDDAGNSYAADGRSARIAVGYRFMGFSVEGMYSGYGLMLGGPNAVAAETYDSRTLQIAGKYNLAIGSGFELFGRLGLIRTDVNATTANNVDLSGDGWTMSVGVEYRLNLVLTGLGIYMDWTRNSADLDYADGGTKFANQTASMWTLGVNLSL